MKLSLKWIQEFVAVDEYFSKPNELATLLTQAGFEVESIHDSRSLYHQVAVGQILEKNKHPNADKLSVCLVTTGQNQVHQIVCGAQNHKTGDRVVLALPGAVLPGGLAIKKSALRGVESSGMLCSFKELGLEGSGDGIAILDSQAPVGKAFAEFYGLDDLVFELKVTPNRADGLSHLGLAREIAALLEKEMKPGLKPLLGQKSQKSGPIQVEVLSQNLCPRYMGVYIENVKVQNSPAWIQKRLESVGLKSINNVVDVTNLILMELGQPLHAFDAGQIRGEKIRVSVASVGEEFTTLDQKKLKLTSDNLTIRDSERALCLAGVMGGLNSGTTVDTQNVFLEAAYFLPDSVRKTSRQYGLDSDSAYRFSRGIDSELTPFALRRAADLISELTGGKISNEYIDHDTRDLKVHKIEVSESLLTNRLGYPVSFEKMKNYATRLHFKIENVTTNSMTLVAPTFRHDISHPMDFVEEYARLDGYDKIPETLPPLLKNPTTHDVTFTSLKSLANLATASGFSQSLNYAFCSKKSESQFLGSTEILKNLGFKIKPESIAILNPLNEELNVMRSSLAFGLWNNILHNYRYGIEQGELFEMGQTFFQEGPEMNETLRLSMAVWGNPEDLWNKPSHKINPVFRIKSFIEQLATSWKLSSLRVTGSANYRSPDFLHKGQWAVIEFRNHPIGWVGTLHPQKLADLKIRVPVAMMEIELGALIEGQSAIRKITTPLRYQAVTRDLALVMPKNLNVGDLLKTVQHKAGPTLISYKVLDIFEGEPIDLDKKSVSIRLVWQDPAQSLQEEAVNLLQTQLLENLTKQFPVALR